MGPARRTEIGTGSTVSERDLFNATRDLQRRTTDAPLREDQLARKSGIVNENQIPASWRGSQQPDRSISLPYLLHRPGPIIIP